MSNQKTRAALLGAVISLCCIGLLLKRVNLDDAWETLRRIDLRLLLFPALIFLLNYPLRALRWQLTFPRFARPLYWAAFRTFAIGTAANNVVPGRAGDVARCALISRDSSLVGSSLALGTLAVEKVLDGLALTAIVLLACAYITPPGWLSKLLLAGIAVFCGALVVMVALWFRASSFIAGVESTFTALHFKSLAKRVSSILHSFTEGLEAISSPKQIAVLVSITAIIWITEAALVWTIAMPLRLPLSFPNAIVVAAIVGLGFMIPASPAAIGTYEFFVVAALGLVGIASGSGLAYAVLLHSWVFVSTSIAGLACLAWAGLTLKQVAQPEMCTLPVGVNGDAK